MAIYKPVYVVNPRKGFVTEMDGEDFANVTRGMTKTIKHPIKTIALTDYPTLKKKFEGYENGILISSIWGFFWKKGDNVESIAPNNARKDIYEVFKCIFENLDYTIHNTNTGIESHL